MKTIRFTQDYTVKGESESYAMGQVVEKSVASADHFIKRGVAEEVEKPAPKLKAKAKPKSSE